MNHYPHHVGDYAKDTMHLSPLEHGVYRLLMDAYYGSEKPIPNDFEAVCRIARCTSKTERAAALKILADFFVSGPDGYRQKRIDEEIAAYQERAEIARTNGRKRKGTQRDTKSDTNLDTRWDSGKEPMCDPNPIPDPIQSGELTSNQKPINSPSLRSGESGRKRPKHPLPEGFGLSERVIDWARGKGYDRLQEHLDAFRLKAVANDYRYVNWDAALMNAIEADWAGVRRGRSEPRGQDAIAAAMASIAAKEGNASH